MPWSHVRRFVLRVRRTVRHHWSGISVSFNGNRVPRQLDFSQGVAHPILLIQGFGSSRRALMVLEKRLRHDGYDVFSVRIGGLFGTLNTRLVERIATELFRKITSLHRRYRLGKLTIIGHSKGGLIGRYLVACLGGAPYCRAVITLGTPHQGFPNRPLSRLAQVTFALPRLRQLRASSRLFRQLACMPIPAHVHCISICSTGDRITPPGICRWTNPHGNVPVNILLEQITHTDYLLKQRVYEKIREHLPPLPD